MLISRVLVMAISLCLLGVPAWSATVSGTLAWSFDLSAHQPGQEADLWIPYPLSDADQRISNLHYSGSFSQAAVYVDRVYRTPMLHVHWDASQKLRVLELSYDVERREVAQRVLPTHEPNWNPGDYALYLAPTSLGPVDGAVGELARKIVSGKQSVLEKARAVYDWTVENTYRNPETRGCGKGDVCSLLQDPGGKCADISSVFVALARAAGVPTREVFGIRLGKKDGQDVSSWQHCWAEFFLPGYGWVSVDPADVRKLMLKEELALDSQRTAELREYFWGGLDPYRVRLSEGRDLQLSPPQQGPAVNYLMYPFAQVGGRTLDWLAPEEFRYSIHYRAR